MSIINLAMLPADDYGKVKAQISSVCPNCGKTQLAPVTSLECAKRFFSRREHIQDIFPEWSAEEREILLSGICPECWEKLFPKDEAEAEDDSGCLRRVECESGNPVCSETGRKCECGELGGKCDACEYGQKEDDDGDD